MANGKRAGLVKAADLVGAADGPGRSSQKGSVDCGRGAAVGHRLGSGCGSSNTAETKKANTDKST